MSAADEEDRPIPAEVQDLVKRLVEYAVADRRPLSLLGEMPLTVDGVGRHIRFQLDLAWGDALAFMVPQGTA